MMMMMKLAEATSDVDVYLVPANAGGGGGRGAGPRPADGAPAAGAGQQRRTVVSRHFNMANLAGYPAVNVVNGFTEAGMPSNITFYARPFCDGELLALAKAYQDATGFHLKHPQLA
jgi:Asp-tRNA(Asn)/Glu-tRNA(Gln) amidotransferase A subunit family amidase